MVAETGWEKLFSTFPSPCGEKVGINGSIKQGMRSRLIRAFPSPCGEKVGINIEYGALDIKAKSNVSVPLRGKGRDQPLRGMMVG